MPKLSRRTLVAPIGAFEPHYARQFLIDNVKLSFSASSDATRARILSAPHAVSPSSLTNTGQLGLRSLAAVRFRRGSAGPGLCWKDRGVIFRQGVRGGYSDRTLVCDFNPIRAVRQARPVGEQRQHAGIPDNYLDPRVVPREVAHEECLRVFDGCVREGREEYCAIVERLWGIELRPHEVLVSVNVIELVWDALVPGQASLATSLFWDGWKRALREPRKIFDIARLEFFGDGMLKAVGKNDEILKLYGKTEDQVRFEAQLTKAMAKKVLGRRIDPGDPIAIRLALAEVADAVYPTILAVQQASITPKAPNLLTLASGIGASPSARYVLGRLVQFGTVKTRGQADYKALRQLRKRGFVQIGPDKGFWSLTDEAAATVDALRRLCENEARWRA